ncbi:MAG: methylenetetrahydrofolate--tRNA-(uracil(54)-C(5))-methyltransferase (FADH(2)-oxidizing) TrmFO [Deltaproteobacteria bacterium]|nr:methylenetetrahydrofolate--tRNA-(uracil(54)-C(5))-methyltransferase (FADH(2)-oxidizing) TrmFO [Deltaproteobacteria bacterium]
MENQRPVIIVGGGLAGCEAALQLAGRGIPVRLFEMKPTQRTEAQVSDTLAELVCSNSFRGAGLESAVGAIKVELRAAGSRLMAIADQTQVPAGGALAVDRERFSAAVTAEVEGHPLIEVVHAAVDAVPGPDASDEVIIATGPLTATALAADIQARCGGAERLYFYDAIAPIVDAESIDTSIAFAASRYGKGEGDDYLNCPMDRETYERFVAAVLAAEKVTPRAFEEAKYFEGCLPIEVMAERGQDTLRYGCMKPVGLPDPSTGKIPWAVVQLRPENRDRTAYNMVGFQTRMKWGPQAEVLRMIPGLERAEFLRMGSIHRNTYLDSPRLLDAQLRLQSDPHISFAGQITGVEGYVESTACGFLVGLMVAARRMGTTLPLPPSTSTLGALREHVLGLNMPEGTEKHGHVPSNIHWGLLPALPGRVPKKERKRRYGERAVADAAAWWDVAKAVVGELTPRSGGA